MENPEINKKIAEALGSVKGSSVIEIGPGHGELTDQLLAVGLGSVGKITCIEKDSALAEYLREKYKGANVEVVEGDALKILPGLVRSLPAAHYKLAGNIPYYITGFLFRLLSGLDVKPERSVFMVQKEVALRAAAKAPDMNRLAAAIQFWADPSIIAMVPKGQFSPPPKVDSAILLLMPRREDPKEEAGSYYRLIRELFSQPRKTILNNLERFAKNSGISREILSREIAGKGIDPAGRPQQLSLAEIERLVPLFAREKL